MFISNQVPNFLSIDRSRHLHAPNRKERDWRSPSSTVRYAHADRSLAALSHYHSRGEGGHHSWPKIEEENKSDRDDPTVHAAGNQAIDETSNRQERKVWKDRRQ